LIGQTLNDLTLFAVDTLASHSAQQANEAAQTTHDTYGQQCTTPFAYYDLDTRSWKTYEGICLWGSIEFSATWPKSGMTQNGKSFQQPPLVRHTKETGYSLWPTPTTQEIEHPNAEVDNDGATQIKKRQIFSQFGVSRRGSNVANADGRRQQKCDAQIGVVSIVGEAVNESLSASLVVIERAVNETTQWWEVEPNVGRVANGVSDRVDRLKGLGNAIVPQVAELVGALVVEHSQN
jgi:hypothetical protein